MFKTRGFIFRLTVVHTVMVQCVVHASVYASTYKTANNDACVTYYTILYVQSSY